MIRVGIVMGSASDWPVMKEAVECLKRFGVPYETHVLSAHRSPELVRRYVATASPRGVQVFIAGAGGAAHLAGVIASQTTLPVIGVPLDSQALKGLDSLLATVQMPRGVPVATVAIGGAFNAALLAIQCLALHDPRLRRELAAEKQRLVEGVRKANQTLGRMVPTKRGSRQWRSGPVAQ